MYIGLTFFKPELTSEGTRAFGQYYMQRVTLEFAEDLDRIRNADDFHDGTVQLLIHALQQGTSILSIEDKQRVVTARSGKES